METIDHWTDEHRLACDRCIALSDLVGVALDMFKELTRSSGGGLITQLCGPMTTGGFNDVQKNMRLFEECILIARQHGWTVFNQVPFQAAMIRITQWAPGAPCPHEIIDDFYVPIFQSGYLARAAFSPLWGTSVGTKRERKILLELSTIRIVDYPVAWHNEAVQRLYAAR